MVARVGSSLAVLVAAALAGAAPAGAANLLKNPGFDASLIGWTASNENQIWSSVDAGDEPGSGSLRGYNDGPSAVFSGVVASQCVPVIAGASYDAGFSALLPAGQERSGEAAGSVYFYAEAGCAALVSTVDIGGPISTPGAWQQVAATVASPAGAKSARFFLLLTKNEAGGTFVAHFDDTFLCSDADCSEAAPEPPYASWISSPELPGFEAQVRITPSGSSPLEAKAEDDCIAEAICAHGAVAGRPEVFVKVIGPRPNGYLWVQLVRFTPSQVEVWLRQESTGEVEYYRVPPTVAGSGELSGLEDRTAFLP